MHIFSCLYKKTSNLKVLIFRSKEKEKDHNYDGVYFSPYVNYVTFKLLKD